MRWIDIGFFTLMAQSMQGRGNLGFHSLDMHVDQTCRHDVLFHQLIAGNVLCADG